MPAKSPPRQTHQRRTRRIAGHLGNRARHGQAGPRPHGGGTRGPEPCQRAQADADHAWQGLLTRDESERSHVYAAAQSQKATQGGLLKDLIRKAFAGSGKALVLAALREGHVSKRDRAEIEALLREESKDEPRGDKR